DGYAATRAIRAMEADARHTPVIALTASVMREDRERCLAAGMDDFIAKPVMPEQLESVLARWAPRPPGTAVAPGAAASDAGGAVLPPEPIDWTVLEDLLEVTHPEFISDLLGVFLRDARAVLGDLDAVRRRGDAASWGQIAHRFRGSCATLGARGMVQLTTRMEALDQAELEDQGRGLLGELQAELGRVEQALRSEKDRAGAPYDLGALD
ncbi:MAG TPA: Hpt domain-containing protein, partial [Vicinamibacteria bacterium]|nr:Hpt domain-containing protein [Vicinamibacteria bacterium]